MMLTNSIKNLTIKRFTLNINIELMKKVKIEAKKQNMSQAYFIGQVLKKYLEEN